MKRSALVLILAAGALARLGALGMPGTRDVPDWKATSFVASSDFTRIYGAGGSPPDERVLLWEQIKVKTEYPPVSQLEMALVGRVYRLIDPEFSDGRTLTALIKAPGLIAEVALAWLLLTWGRRTFGAAAEWAAAAYWINPATWLTGSVLGYLDAQMAVPATLALLAAASARPGLAGALAGIAVLTKPQAIFILPVVGMMLLRRDSRAQARDAVRAIVAGFVVATLAVLPFLLAGTWPSMLRAFARFGEHDLVSGTATNMWWALTWAAGSVARLPELGWIDALSRPATMVRISVAVAAGIPNPRLVGTILTAGAIAWGAWRSRQGLDAERGTLVAAWSVLAYFILSGQVHENHAFLALPLLAFAAGANAGLRPWYWAISAAYALNVYLFYGLGMTSPPWIDRRWTFVDMTVLLAIFYCVLFVGLTFKVARATRVRT
ncbi:MAG TPA: glycosyltransferase 87 family protein [Vicinamibacterales bacterium]|nr:glycosyltransferase 87 family protein [Vicinamibacterales bacterium]